MAEQTENEVLTSLQKLFTKRNKKILVGIGDDAAVTLPTKKHLVYTCDTQVENTHFKTNEIDPKQLGFRAMSAGISDIAAMGATPTFCLVSLFIPKRTDTAVWIKQINQGIVEASKEYGVSIIGGNIAKSSLFAIDIFAIGEGEPEKLLQKTGAKPDDAVFVTGFLGDAHTGWELLQNPSIKLSAIDKQYLKTHHFKPHAKVKESQVLANLKCISAMTDLSDGLATDLLHICKASRVGVRIDAQKIPISPAVRAYAKATNQNPVTLALEGGEDFALCFTAPEAYEKRITQSVKEKTGTTIYRIGTICSQKEGHTLVLEDGGKQPLAAIGFDNLA